MNNKKINKIKIKPNDNAIRAYGNVNITWNTALFELFNNSIQAAEDRDLDLNICVDFVFSDDENSNLEKVIVIDGSGGIDRENIEHALTPGNRKSAKTTLSEHGLGLNIALEFLAKKGIYKIFSQTKMDKFLIKDKVSYSKDIRLLDSEQSLDDPGLKIILDDLGSSSLMTYPTRAQSTGFNVWMECCKKYRYKYEQFSARGKRFTIVFNYICGERRVERKFSPIAPVLKNPINGKEEWLTEFKLSDGKLAVLFKLGVADEDKEKYKYDLKNGNQAFNQIHPYRVSHNTCGFETIYKDVVIESANLKTIPIVKNSSGGNWQVVSLMRGEFHILSGASSVFTKDSLQKNRQLSLIIEKAIAIFNGEEPHPVSGKKIDFMKDYINRRNYSKDGVPPEKIIKHRHRQTFESLGFSVTQEETSCFGIVDMVVGDIVMEHKRKETTPDDVMQLVKYILAFAKLKKFKKYELWAPKHSDAAISITQEINDRFLSEKDYSICLKELPPILLNPNLTTEEKQIIHNVK